MFLMQRSLEPTEVLMLFAVPDVTRCTLDGGSLQDEGVLSADGQNIKNMHMLHVPLTEMQSCNRETCRNRSRKVPLIDHSEHRPTSEIHAGKGQNCP